MDQKEMTKEQELHKFCEENNISFSEDYGKREGKITITTVLFEDDEDKEFIAKRTWQDTEENDEMNYREHLFYLKQVVVMDDEPYQNLRSLSTASNDLYENILEKLKNTI